ncbi:steryl acetyl hydrolase [Pseudoroseomonas wenyumeiae]|uniref:Alpha/beta hydrolase n=1 Tax=Teichococcus wenyumeiae TaxID=2478470 RepID=A0A3A9K0G0_9PROT|nr:alpha/beta hydrolase [Pseudoroseomonas wenyumeiae]RKK04839.1 alpha/beta hydrolase [Pseudoroseomonas wenyumeiae]RMI20526.1 steryl acetyl hydrolase [Pseudoroseomonas wenyumeiae]
MPALHPDLINLLQLMRQNNSPTYESLPPAEARKAHAARAKALQTPGDPLPSVQDLRAAHGGTEVPVRLYRAEDAPEHSPCLLFMHGGGWVLGSLETHDWVCRRLARELGACVLAVDYRLAPEHPYPAAVEDCVAALHWLVAEAPSLGIDPARIALGGDSAGGNLAAVLALMGRDGAVPPTVFQLLFYPAMDLALRAESYGPPTEGMVLTPATMRYFIGHYLPSAGAGLDWQASPLRAASLHGTPPALVMTCGHDPLREEGLRYAERLEQDGVRVTRLDLNDQTHAILTMDKVSSTVPAVLSFAAGCLRQAWAP